MVQSRRDERAEIVMGMEIYANCHTLSSTCPDFLSVEAPGDGEEN